MSKTRNISNLGLFVQESSGAVPRTIPSKLSDLISVKDFGVLGTGANEAFLIQSALNATIGKSLVFPSGNYSLGGSTVSGSGNQTVIFQPGAAVTNGTLLNVSRITLGTGPSRLIDVRASNSNPDGVAPSIINIVSGKGDNSTFMGVMGGYFQARDLPDVTESTKGVLYGLALSVVPRFPRDNIPFDDVVGLVVQNDSQVLGARGTDALYVGRNSTFFPEDTPEWVTGLTIGANCGYGFRSTGATFVKFDAAGRMYGGAGNSFGFLSRGQVQRTVSTNAYYFRTESTTENASFTLSNLRHYHATQAQFGAQSTVLNQYGFMTSASLTGGQNNFGFYGDIPEGPNSNWNIYVPGLAPNWIGGKSVFGLSPSLIQVSDGFQPTLQVSGNDALRSSGVVGRFTNDEFGPTFYFQKSRGTSVGSNGVVLSGDDIACFIGEAYSGSSLLKAAAIKFKTAGTITSSSIPGRIEFSTVSTGSNVLTPKVKIKETGVVQYVPLPTQPSVAEEGDVYFDSGSKKLRCYDGSNWRDLF